MLHYSQLKETNEREYEVWLGYCKFIIEPNSNITDILEEFRALDGITIVASKEISRGPDREVYLVRFKYIKHMEWRQYYKFLKRMVLFHPDKSRRISGVRKMIFLQEPERLV